MPLKKHFLNSLILWLVAICGLLSAELAAQDNDEVESVDEVQVFISPPRELQRPLMRAKEAIEKQDFRLAIEMLSGILDDHSSEDFFFVDPDDPLRATSIRLRAQQLLGTIPVSSRSDYELRYSVVASQMLQEAIKTNDPKALAQVSQSFFLTSAGQTATVLLGHHYFDTGNLTAARRHFEKIVAIPALVEGHDPDVSIMLALCYYFEGEEGKGCDSLLELTQRNRARPIFFNETLIPAFRDASEAARWLASVMGKVSTVRQEIVSEWRMFRGNALRNASQVASLPLATPRWWVPTLNSPRDELIAATLFQSRRQSAQVLPVSIQPLAIGNTIVTRSLDRLTGIDLATGKRIWEYPAWLPGFESVDEQLADERMKETTQRHIEQRIWNDHLYGQLSSNGKDVYFVDQPGFSQAGVRRLIVPGDRSIDDPLGDRVVNALKCIELDRQGAFRWEVGGESGGAEPALAGAFFLGAPLLASDGLLYVICEQASEGRLVALDPETGKLEWSQQIGSFNAGMELGENPIRRLGGATPSESGGVLVCPTSAGCLVALDIHTRSLLWGSRYPTLSGIGMESMRSIWPTSSPPDVSDHGTPAMDSSVTIAGDRVIILPVESDRVFCFDLNSGQPNWTGSDGLIGHPRLDGLFISCVADDVVVLTGSDRVWGLDLQTGESRWELSLDTFGQPSGRGCLANGKYFLPTENSLILECDVATGKITRQIKTSHVPGNLISHRGDLISQGHDFLSVYHQAETIRAQLAKTSKNTADTGQVVLSAQLLAFDGELRKAVSTVESVLDREDGFLARQTMVRQLLDWLTIDYSSAREVAERHRELLERFAPTEWFAVRLRGSLETGEIADALEFVAGGNVTIDEQELVSAPREFGLDRSHRVTGKEALRMLFRDASSTSNRGGLDAAASQLTVSDWLAKRERQLSLDAIKRLIDWIGDDAFSADTLRGLAESQLVKGEFLECGRTVARLQKRADDFQNLELECRLLRTAGWEHQAIARIQTFASMHPEVSGTDKQGTFPVGDTASRWFGESVGKNQWSHWADGLATSTIERQESGGDDGSAFLIKLDCLGQGENAPDDLSVLVDITGQRLFVYDSLGNRLGYVDCQLKDPSGYSSSYYPSRMSVGHYSLHGHLLTANCGFDLVGIDLNQLRNGVAKPLWHRNLLDEVSISDRDVLCGMQTQYYDVPWGRARYQLIGPGETLEGNFAATANNVYFVTGTKLGCVDALTGRLRWQRGNVPKYSRVLADKESVFLLTPLPGSTSAARVENAVEIDGTFGFLRGSSGLGEVSAQTLWHGFDSTAVMTLVQGRENVLRGIDLRNGNTNWEYRCPTSCSGELRDSRTMVICQWSGEIDYLDLQTGEVLCRLDIGDLEAKTVQVQRLRDCDLILCSSGQPVRTTLSSNGRWQLESTTFSTEFFNGTMVCVDPVEKRLCWPSPVRVENFSVPLQQPMDLPLMPLTRIARPGDRRMGSVQLEVYAIDLRSGRLASVVKPDGIDINRFSIRGIPESSTMEVQIGDYQLLIQLTDQAVPPSAPAQLTDRFTINQIVSEKAIADSVDDPVKRQRELIRRLLQPAATPDDNPKKFP